jgi:hypothetical protein
MKFASPQLHCAGIALALLFAYPGIFASHSAQDMQSAKETVLAASTQSVELTANPVRVKLTSEMSDKNTTLDQMLESLPASRNVYLVVTGLHAVKEPGTLFHLYLDLPEGVTPKPDNAWHIGSINFYNAVPVPDAPKDKPESPVSIDITNVLRNLRSSQKLTPETTVTIMPTRPLEAGSEPIIGHITITAN